MTSLDQFDETDLSSYYFQGLKKDDAIAILADQNEGVFLVRDSSRGGYVVCVKENETVMEYLVQTHPSGKLFIRSEFHFKDLAALLSFYKKNMFTSSALIRPVAKEKVFLQMHPMPDRSENTPTERRTIVPGGFIPEMPRSPSPNPRASAPPIPFLVGDSNAPIYAKVVKARTPIAYDTQALPLKVGEVIRVTKRANGQGFGEILTTGKRGHFPLTHVEIMREVEKLGPEES